MAHEVFISHSSKDKAIGDAVCASVEHSGVRCWIAPRDIRSGQVWAEAIVEAIQGSRIMVLIFSSDSNNSKDVAKELTVAVDSGVIVIPFRIDDIKPRGVMRYYLSDTHWLDAMNPPTEGQINELVDTVKSVIEKPEVSRFAADTEKRGRKTAAEGNRCPSCGALAAAGVKFCAVCGAEIMKVCPGCDKENPADRRFCEGCGADVPAFLKLREALPAMRKHFEEKRWGAVEKEYGLLPEGLKCSGGKGNRLLEEIESLHEESERNIRRTEELEGEIEMEKGAEGAGLDRLFRLLTEYTRLNPRSETHRGLLEETGLQIDERDWEDARGAAEEAEEREDYRKVIECFKAYSGKHPAGRYSREAGRAVERAKEARRRQLYDEINESLKNQKFSEMAPVVIAPLVREGLELKPDDEKLRRFGAEIEAKLARARALKKAAEEALAVKQFDRAIEKIKEAEEIAGAGELAHLSGRVEAGVRDWGRKKSIIYMAAVIIAAVSVMAYVQARRARNFEVAVERYREVKAEYEELHSENRELLEEYGGERWREAREGFRLEEAYEDNPAAGIAVYSRAARELRSAVERSRGFAQDVAKYRRAREEYEELHSENRELLEEYGGERWREAREGFRLEEACEDNPAEGREAYRKASGVLREIIVAAMLKVAGKAREVGQWEKVLERAEVVLELDSENDAARALKSEAEDGLEPRWRLITTLEGREVAGKIMMGGRAYTSPHTFHPGKGRGYKASFRYESGERRYAADAVIVVVDWKGLREERIVLAEYHGPVEGRNWRSPATGMQFVWIEQMGMWVGKYEVTNNEYRRKEPGKNSGRHERYTLNMGRQPVVGITFDDAKTYADWMTERDRYVLVRDYRYRLPSEAEWTTFARCGDGREYPWGNNWPPVSGQAGNYADETYKRGLRRYSTRISGIDGYDDGHVVTAPVDELWVNPWGLAGVGGNVWEICASDSTGMLFGAHRGASWRTHVQDGLRCSYRSRIYRYETGGFRLVLSR